MLTLNDILLKSKDDFSDIVMDRENLLFTEYTKINVYTKRNLGQKIWIKTPKLRLCDPSYRPNNQKYIDLLPITLFDKDDIIKFENLLDELEKSLSEKIKKLNNDLVPKYSISKNETIYNKINFQLPFNIEKNEHNISYKFKIFNEFDREINLTTFDKNYIMACIIELTNIWVNETKFGFNWTVLQMKIYQDFDLSKSLFDDSPIKISEKKSPPPPPPPIMIKNKEISQKNINVNGSFVPTIDELMSSIKRLKSINNSNENSINDQELNQKNSDKDNIVFFGTNTQKAIEKKNNFNIEKKVKKQKKKIKKFKQDYEKLLLEIELDMLAKANVEEEYQKIIGSN